MHAVVETTGFLRDAKVAAAEIFDLVTHLALNPLAGDVVVGTGGARKLRWRRPGTGKSGGYRVVTYYAAADLPVFLVAVFTKAVKATLTQAERNGLRDELVRIADGYRRYLARTYGGRR